MTRTEANAMVLSVLPMVRMLVRRRIKSWPWLQEDMVQACVVALLEHADQYDPARGAPTTWAWQWVRATVNLELGLGGYARGYQNWSDARFAVERAKSLERPLCKGGRNMQHRTIGETIANGAPAIDDVVAAREELAIAVRWADRTVNAEGRKRRPSKLTSKQLLMLGETGSQTEVARAAGVRRQRVEQFRDAVVAELRRAG